MVSLRTETAKFFREPDGTKVAEISPAPIHFQGPDGLWHDIDPLLVPAEDPAYAWRNTAGGVVFEFAPSVRAGDTVRVRVGGEHLRFGPLGVVSPQPGVVTGSQITYPNVFPGIDLRYTVLLGGLKEEFILHQMPTVTSFAFEASGTLSVEASAAGAFDLVDAAGEAVLRIPAPVMYESDLPEHPEPRFSTAVSLAVEAASGVQLLTLTFDPVWLADPTRRWPVYVDPSITTLNPSADTLVHRCYPNQNFNTSTMNNNQDLRSGSYGPCENNSSINSLARTLIKFSHSGFGGTTIEKANLRLYNYYSGSCTTRTTEVRRITENWGVNNVTWNNRPSGTSSGMATASFAHGRSGCDVNGAWVTWEITNLFQGWVNGTWPNYGVLVRAANEADSLTWRRYRSTEYGSQIPRLVVTYNNAPAKPTLQSPANNTISSNDRPTLQALYNDVDGDDGRIRFEVRLNNTNDSTNCVAGVCISASEGRSGLISPNTGFSWQVPADRLSDGTYKWRASADDGTAPWVWSGYRLYTVDTTPPPPPTISSSTHPNQDLWYSNNGPTLIWSADDLSGINGYSYVLDQNPSTTPDTNSQGTATSISYSGLEDGIWYFHVRARNGVNLWSDASHYKLQVDTTAPSDPVITSSSHLPYVQSADRTVEVCWSASSDTHAGVAGYSWAFNKSETMPANTTLNGSASTTCATSASLENDTWWFHVRALDNANPTNPGTDVTYGPIEINGDGPNAPTISSPTHDENEWSSNRDACFTWTPATTGPETAAYSVVFNQEPDFEPLEQESTVVPAWCESDVPDGEWYLHVRARSVAGAWGATAHYRIRVDGTLPGAPTVSSPTHPNPESVYDLDDAEVQWWGPEETSGIDGYSWILDQSPDTIPDETAEPDGTTAWFSDLSVGEHFFHVRARNGAGTWGETAHFRLYNHPLAQPFYGAAEDNTESPPSIDFPAVPDIPETFDSPVGGLGSIFPEGGLLGSDSFFGGELLPASSPASAAANVFGSMSPPLPALVDLGSPIDGILGRLRDIHELAPVFRLIDVPTFQAETVRYASDGSVESIRSDLFLTCRPTTYSSSTDLLQQLNHDLRITLCPDPSSFEGPNQRLIFKLDALKSGVRVKVTATLRLNDQQLRLIQVAHSRDLPADLGSGPAVDTSYPCLLAPPVLVLPPIDPSVPGDTAEGTCVELTVTPGSDLDNTSGVTMAASQHVEGFDVYLDVLSAGGSFLPRAHFGVEEIPASEKHAYTMYTQEPRTDRRTMRLRLRLEDSAANPNESVRLERFAPSDGRLLTKLALTDIPTYFETDMVAELDEEGDLETARLLKAVISSGNADSATPTVSQPSAPNQRLAIEQRDGEEVLGELAVSSFAPAYRISMDVLQDSNGNTTGGSIASIFPAGPPFQGRLLMREFRNGVLDTEMDLSRFASSTTFSGRTLRPRTKPTGMDLSLLNSETVDGQLIQLRQFPAGAPPRRVVLKAAGVNSIPVTTAVAGDNLVWEPIPRTFDLYFRVEYQDESDLPSRMRMYGTSVGVSADDRLELTRRVTTPVEGVSGLIIKSLKASHKLDVHLKGTPSAIESARLERDSGTTNPTQALQITFHDTDGALVSQAKFLGPTATTTGLIPGTGRDLNALASDVPGHFAYGINLTTDDNARPVRASITGGGDPAPDMDIRFEDLARGYSLRQRSLPDSFRYDVVAGYAPNGTLNLATVQAVEQSDNNSGGLLDFEYSGLRLRIQGMTQTFRYTASIDGPLNDPTRATIQQRRSSVNPQSVVQMIRYTPTRTVRLAFTLRGDAAPGSPLPEQGSRADLKWVGIPEDFDLTVGRGDEGGISTLTLSGDSFGADMPDADMFIRQDRHQDGRQEFTMQGMPSRFSIKGTRQGEDLNDPDTISLDLRSSTRHTTDRMELRNFEQTGELRHRVRFLGGDLINLEPCTKNSLNPDGTCHADATFQNTPEATYLHYQRTTAVINAEKRDKSFSAEIRNYSIGESLDDRTPVAVPAGSLTVYLRDPNMLIEDGLGEYVRVSDLPQWATFSYTRPDTNETKACMGDIAYEAQSSDLDLDVSLSNDTGCLPGRLTASMTDVPRGGFVAARLDENGNGLFETDDGEVSSLYVDVPAPRRLRTQQVQLNNGQPGTLKALCLKAGLRMCFEVEIDAKASYPDLRASLRATSLRRLELRARIPGPTDDMDVPGYVSDPDENDRLMWNTIPLLGIKFDGGPGGVMQAKFRGTDDPEEDNFVTQTVSCCTFPIAGGEGIRVSAGPTPLNSTLNLDGKPSSIRFYGWDMRPNASGVLAKYNDDHQELVRGFGSYVKPLHPPVPFEPRFIAGSPSDNSLIVPSGTTRYFVPSLFDVFFSTLDENDEVEWRWTIGAPLWQTDWLFQILLHEMEPDLLGFTACPNPDDDSPSCAR